MNALRLPYDVRVGTCFIHALGQANMGTFHKALDAT